MSVTNSELEWLKQTCPYLKPHYVEYLSNYRYKPEQVQIHFVPVSEDSQLGRIEIEASGLWVETIMWEVPLMACLSEIYFRTVDTDWTFEGQDGALIIHIYFLDVVIDLWMEIYDRNCLSERSNAARSWMRLQ